MHLLQATNMGLMCDRVPAGIALVTTDHMLYVYVYAYHIYSKK